MEGGARPGGVDHRTYDNNVVKDFSKGFNPDELSPAAKALLF